MNTTRERWAHSVATVARRCPDCDTELRRSTTRTGQPSKWPKRCPDCARTHEIRRVAEWRARNPDRWKNVNRAYYMRHRAAAMARTRAAKNRRRRAEWEAAGPHIVECKYCATPFELELKPGRRREYCDAACKAAAERARRRAG